MSSSATNVIEPIIQQDNVAAAAAVVVDHDDNTRSFSFDPPLYIQRKMFISNYIQQQYFMNRLCNNNNNNNSNNSNTKNSKHDDTDNMDNDDTNDDHGIRLIDVGCGNGDLLLYLREAIQSHDVPYVRLDGLDKCEQTIQSAMDNVRPMLSHYLNPYDHQLTLSLYHMDAITVSNNLLVLLVTHDDDENDDTPNRGGWSSTSSSNSNSSNSSTSSSNRSRNDDRYHVTVCTEVIEHVHKGEELQALTHFLFQCLQSDMIIVTTPNREFNPWFFGYGGDATSTYNTENENNGFDVKWMRHDDHKFEFSRSEFEQWANHAITCFNNSQHNVRNGVRYQLELIGGVGTGTLGDLSLGYATQIAVFKRINHLIADDDGEHETNSEHVNNKHESTSKNRADLWSTPPYVQYQYPVREIYDQHVLLKGECIRAYHQYQQWESEDFDEHKEEPEEEEPRRNQLIAEGWVPMNYIMEHAKRTGRLQQSNDIAVHANNHHHMNSVLWRRREIIRKSEVVIIDNEQQLVQLLSCQFPNDFEFMSHVESNQKQYSIYYMSLPSHGRSSGSGSEYEDEEGVDHSSTMDSNLISDSNYQCDEWNNELSSDFFFA